VGLVKLIEKFCLNSDRLKKVASIFLLAILLFNWFGYRLVIGYWQERTKSDLEARLDVEEYDESQLMTVKIPMTHLSYYNTSPEFERVNGSVDIGGVQYKYVKRRLYNDSLELVCLPDQNAMKLRATAIEFCAAGNDFYKVTNGLQANTGKRTGGHSLPVKNLVVDPYVLLENPIPGAPSLVSVPVSAIFTCYFPSLFPVVDERPPASMV
jgi:hypothetical protein